MEHLRAAFRRLLDILFPPVCVSCKGEGDFWCEACILKLDKKKIKSHSQKVKDPDFQYLDGVIYALDYAKNPQVKAAVKQFKYRFTEEMADYFADLIAEKIGELGMVKNRRIILIPVPLHKKRMNYRGFNQAERIARAVQSRLSNDTEIIPFLERCRNTSQQAKLHKEARNENLKDAFKMNTKFVHEQKKCTNSIIFLVDDICTTGSTLENCAETLKFSGFSKVYGLVIARAFK